MIQRTLPLDQVSPGMQLVTAVRDDHEVILLAAACVLTEAQIAALRQHGISQVTVAEADTLSDPEREARRAAMRARMAHLFRHTGEMEANRLLQEIMLDYRLEQAG